jgi:glutaminyl-peptide cyclotransferase
MIPEGNDVHRRFVCCVIICVAGGCLFGSGCRRATEQTGAPGEWPAFNQQSAYEEVQNLVDFGSRAAGTPGHRHAGNYMLSRLRAAGLNPSFQVFTNVIDGKTITYRNVEAVIPGQKREIILLTTHYDGRQQASPDFQSANSAGSGPAVLLEIARVLKSGYDGNGPQIRLVFFDGQEPVVQHGYADGLQGSRYYARQLVQQGLTKAVAGVINLDMVGDRDLSVTLPKNVSKDLRRLLLAAAHAENAREYFRLMPVEIGDDHDSFLHYGMPAINMIDFEYGSTPGQNDYWRTEQDTIDKISPDSLGIIGRVTLRLIRDVVSAREGIAL